MCYRKDLELMALEPEPVAVALGADGALVFGQYRLRFGLLMGPEPRDLRLGKSLHGRISGPRPRDLRLGQSLPLSVVAFPLALGLQVSTQLC